MNIWRRLKGKMKEAEQGSQLTPAALVLAHKMMSPVLELQEP